jgi:hypothetical protein
LETQLYLHDELQKYLQDQISQFVDLFILKLKPVFENIDKEAEEHGNNFFNKVLGHSHSDAIDPSDLAEEAMDRSFKHWEFLNHGRYVLIASWHVALYEAFEQQLRSYLFRELSHDFDLNINHVFSKFDDLKKIFILYQIDLASLNGLKQIDHLRLLCNVIKHGEGTSANNLRKKRPDLIKTHDDIEYLNLYESSLLYEVLEISEKTLAEFGNAIKDFWDSFPERSFCKDRNKLLSLLNKNCKR